ncbi:MAG: hypothetical protein JKY48_03400, partial [Flavobacteriales bacterium]|nr:hypothetical protein [Flavobacteriales bacterium]
MVSGKSNRELAVLESIDTFIWKNKHQLNDDISLMKGLSGLALFYFNLHQLTKKEQYLDRFILLLEECFDLINNNKGV